MAQRGDTPTVLPVMFEPGLAGEWTASGRWPGRTLDDYVRATGTSAPRRTAVVDTRRRLSYAELDAEASRCARALHRSGVRRGDTVSVQLPNWAELVVVALACAKAGAVFNHLSTILRENELRRMLGLCRPTVLVVPQRFKKREYADEYGDWLGELDSLARVVVVDGTGPDRPDWVSWEQFLRTGDEALAEGDATLGPPVAEDVCELIFTSGTSGEPKGVLHTSNTLGACAAAVVAAQPITGDDVMLMPATFGHQTAYVWGVWMTFVAGATLVLQESWGTEEFFRLVARERVTMVKGSTPYLIDVAAQLDSDGAADALASLEVFFLGGAPIPRRLAADMEQRALFRLSPCWGMSENGPVTATWPPDPAELTTTTDGHPYPGMEVEVRDESGRPVLDAEGDLFVRGPFNFAGYLQGPELTRRFLAADGWFDTGDRAVLQAQDNCVRITGRRKDIIVRGGEKIPVVEIEQLIASHPNVSDVALVGIPDPRLGEIVCAVVQPRAGCEVDPDEILAYLDDRKVTKQYLPEAFAVVADMPRTVSGKIRKHLLLDLPALQVQRLR